MKRTVEIVLVALALSLFYWILRYPMHPLDLAWLDDGESLYHTFLMLSGKIIYRDDFNHHFPGYLFPFLLVAKVFGFSLKLIWQTQFATQIGTALGVFLILRLLYPFLPSLLGGMIAIAAREPYTIGFFPQQEINLLAVFLVFFSVVAVEKNSLRALAGACFLAGFSFVFDQRAIFLTIIPLGALWIMAESKIRSAILGACFFLIAPLLLALYLYNNDALNPFYEQTFLFPSKYRIGGTSLLESLLSSISVHQYIITLTPFLFISAAIGIFSPIPLEKTRRILLLWIIPCIIMPSFGGRDYEYYSITWQPLLSVFSVVALCAVSELKRVPSIAAKTLPVLSIVFPLLSSLMIQNSGEIAAYDGDGISEAESYLRTHMKPEETLFVWGYRLELYPRLQRLSPYQLASLISVHPDGQVKSPEERQKHVYPKYEELFLHAFRSSPPQWLVVYEFENSKDFTSRAKDEVFALIKKEYRIETIIYGRDFRGRKTRYAIYSFNYAPPTDLIEAP